MTIDYGQYAPGTQWPTPNPIFWYDYGQTNARWKCPDCNGWVSPSVPVHHCAVVTTTTETIPLTSPPFTGGSITVTNPHEYVTFNGG